MNSSVRHPDAFQIFIYDSNLRCLNTTKEEVLKSGFYNVMSETDRKESISIIIKINLQVVITDHRLADGLDAFMYVEGVWEFSQSKK